MAYDVRTRGRSRPASSARRATRVCAAFALLTVAVLGMAGCQPAASASSVALAPVSGPEVDGTAVVSGGVQRIAVDVTTGVYKPNIITLTAGVPAEITFSQGPGCTGSVQSQELGFSADISAGPKVVKIGAQQPGTYGFACGMDMVHGRIIVR